MQHTEFKENDVRGILTPTDEFEIWIENERGYGMSDDTLKRKAENINQHFSKISK